MSRNARDWYQAGVASLAASQASRLGAAATFPTPPWGEQARGGLLATTCVWRCVRRQMEGLLRSLAAAGSDSASLPRYRSVTYLAYQRERDWFM